MSAPRQRAAGPLLGLLITAGLLGGCVYYNGMYNANRLAKSARKAEREGRTFDASSLWGQVATKAESVVVRHPRSKYAEEAAVLRGIALARLSQCEQGLVPLSRASLLPGRSELEEEALLAAGRCQLALGNPVAADAAFSQLLDSGNPARRLEAHLQHARLARQAGRYEEAIRALDGIGGARANSERLLALAGAGREAEALVLADSLVARADTTTPWDSLVAAFGRLDPSGASALVDRMERLPNRPAQIRARWLVEDGLRLVQSDTARAAARFRQAIEIGEKGDLAGYAHLQLVRLELGRVATAGELEPLVQKLRDLAARYPASSASLSQLEASSAGVLAAASMPIQAPMGDLRGFLAAEAARDTLAAPRLANGLFRRIVDGWPDSPYAPKAVLAARQLDPAWTDSALALLEERYADSPYLALIRGESTPEFRQLEDSLGAFAANLAPATPAGRRPPPGARAPAPGRRVEDDLPERRPQPTPGARVLEAR